MGTDREHGVRCGDARRLRSGELLGDEGGSPRADAHARARGARHGITCNAIVPGVIGTEAFNFGNPKMNERMVQRTAMRRAGEPQDVANAIAFLCSDLASYITGVGLNVSGGIELFTF